MMKHTKHLLVLWAALLLGAGNAWGETFTITFKQNANDGSAALTASSFSEQVTAGSSYISSVANLSKVYAGKSGIKLGSSSAIGAFSITFNQAYKITNVSISAVKYGSDTGKIKCGVSSTSTTTSTVSLSSTATECPFTFNGSEISTIYIATSAKRAYIASITVTYETGSTGTTLYLGQEMELFWNPARRFAVFGTPPVASLLVPFKRGQCFFLRAEAILLCGLPFLRGVPVGRRVWNFNFVRKTSRFLEPHPSLRSSSP